MRCANCGAEIASGVESGTRRAERPGTSRPAGRALRRLMLGVFSAGWVVTAAISEYWHVQYVNQLHRVDFAQQTPPFFFETDIHYRFPSFFYFRVSCLWLALVLIVWAWKLATHIERTKAFADAFCCRSPVSED